MDHSYSWFIPLLKSIPGLEYQFASLQRVHEIPKFDRFLLLGPRAFEGLTSQTLHERYCGTPLIVKGVLGTTTYAPASVHEFGTDDDEDASDEFLGTQKSNYRFWIIRDIKKLLELPYRPEELKMNYVIYPTLKDTINLVREAKVLYVDIETNSQQELNCIGIGNGREVHVVPVYNYRNKLMYTNIVDLFVALARFKGQIVCHNALFDMFVLIWRYRIPFSTRNIYDTMVAHHRVFPESEKSLRHAIRAWTWLPYHKDEGVYEPRNPDEEYQLYMYNAKDVHGMTLVHEQLKRNHTPSVQQGVESVYPYLITMLRGMEVDSLRLMKMRLTLQKRENILVRMCRILTGNPKFNPNSSTQCANYFHGRLRYPLIRRSDSGRAALGKKELYQLALRHDNPLIPLILAAREVSKAKSMLTFIPYEMG